MVTLGIHTKIVLDLFNKRFPGSSSIYICTCLSLSHHLPYHTANSVNSYIHLFFICSDTLILQRGRSSLAQKIIHI